MSCPIRIVGYENDEDKGFRLVSPLRRRKYVSCGPAEFGDAYLVLPPTSGRKFIPLDEDEMPWLDEWWDEEYEESNFCAFHVFPPKNRLIGTHNVTDTDDKSIQPALPPRPLKSMHQVDIQSISSGKYRPKPKKPESVQNKDTLSTWQHLVSVGSFLWSRPAAAFLLASPAVFGGAVYFWFCR